MNSNCDKDILMKAMEDEDTDVRLAAVKYCNGNHDVLMQAVEDD